MPVIAPVELDDLVAAGESARQPKTRHRGFSSAVDHPYFFDRRHPSAYQFGEFHFEWIRNSKTQSAFSDRTNRIDHHLRSVSKNRRAPAADVINVFLSVDIPDPRAGCALHKKGRAADIPKRADRRIHTARDALLRGRKKFRRMASHPPKIIIKSLNR